LDINVEHAVAAGRLVTRDAEIAKYDLQISAA
jgi:hypothetical protein